MIPYGLKRKRNYLYTDSPEWDYDKMKRRERQAAKREIKKEVDELKQRRD